MCAISAEVLGKMLESFLADQPHAVALEYGELLFDFATARYSVTGEGKCVFHIWSEERNAVRRVVDAEVKPRLLRLSVLRFGQSQPTILETTSLTSALRPVLLSTGTTQATSSPASRVPSMPTLPVRALLLRSRAFGRSRPNQKRASSHPPRSSSDSTDSNSRGPNRRRSKAPSATPKPSRLDFGRPNTRWTRPK